MRGYTLSSASARVRFTCQRAQAVNERYVHLIACRAEISNERYTVFISAVSIYTANVGSSRLNPRPLIFFTRI